MGGTQLALQTAASDHEDRNMVGLETTHEPREESRDLDAATLTDLAFGIARDAKALMRQQLQMLAAEVREDLQRTKASALLLAVGAATLAFGGLALRAAVTLLLSWAFPDLPLWAAAAIVGGTLAAAGAAFIFAGKRMFASFSPLPEKTFKAL